MTELAISIAYASSVKLFNNIVNLRDNFFFKFVHFTYFLVGLTREVKSNYTVNTRPNVFAT